MRLPRRALPALAASALATPILAPRAEEAVLRAGGTGMALAAMRRVAALYAALHPGRSLELLPSLGTGGGIRALLARAIDLGLLARPLLPEEAARGLRARPYARTPIAIVTGGGTNSAAITLDHFAAILRGDVTTWPEGNRLRLVRREASDSDWQLLAGLSPEMARSVAIALRRPGLVTVGTDQENAEALQAMAGSIGVMSIGQLRAEALRLRPLTLEGAVPDLASVEAGRYPLSRTLHIAWAADPVPGVAPFLDFLAGDAARETLLNLGYGSPAP
ncbi:MAG: substrate-binding domain-containing protein [Roseomonas sp.]|nr:substrate-binding domain-containing protein [Roseomonas sp.]